MPTRKPQDQVETAATPQVDEEDADDELIRVQLGPKAQIPGKPGATRIFHEFDERHPGGPYGGEALVVDGQIVTVYPTLRVNHAIASKLLQRVRTKPATPVPPNVVDLIDKPRDAGAPEGGAAPTSPNVSDGGTGSSGAEQ